VDPTRANHLGIDFLVVHNPLARRPIPHALMVAAREYWATAVKDGYELFCHDTTGAKE
jgi:hypothetical protein